MNIRRVFSRRRMRKEKRARHAFHALAIAALSGAILLTSGLASAEIYRWKDANGTVRYSNRPPDDPALLLDAMPLKQPPSEQSQKSSSYYVQSQSKETLQQEFSGNTIEHLVLPSSVIDNALTNAPAVAEKPLQPVNDDVTASLLARMNDLEQRLQQATANQTDWEQKYQQALLQTEQLEQQNRLLRQTIADMQTTIQQFQEMIASSQNMRIIQPSSQIAMATTENGDVNALIAAQSEQIRQQQREIAQLRQDVQALKTNPVTPSFSSGAASVSASPKLVTRGRIRVVERTTRRQEFAQISKADTHRLLSQR